MIQKAQYACVTLLLLLISFNASAQPGCIGFAADFEFGDDTADLFGKTLFTNTSTWTDSTTQYRWSFGDGDTVYTKVPNHSYLKQGTYTVCLFAYNLKQNGDTTCRDTTCKQVSVSFITSVANPTTTVISIYPNPVNDELVVDIPGMDEAMVSITDVTGRVQLRKAIHGTEAMQVNSLSQGIYYVTVERGGEILHRQRIVK